jgi:hypothetical protein
MLSKRLRPTALTVLLLVLAATVAARANLRRWLVGWPTDTERRLRGRLTRVQFDNVPFDLALERFSRSTGIPFDIDWAALETAGASRKTRVRLRLEDVTVATALNELLRAGLREAKVLPYELTAEGHILLGDAARLDRTTVTRLYDLRDLVESDLRWKCGSDPPPPPLSVESPATAPATQPKSTMQAVVCFFGPASSAPQFSEAPGLEVMYGYVEFVSNGMNFFDGPDLPQPAVSAAGRYLVVTARPSQHAKVAAVLKELRQASRPVRRIEPEHGRAREERTGVGSGLFGG